MDQASIATIFEAYGLRSSQHSIDLYSQYMEDVLEKNKVMNLTGITDCREFVYKHFVDSLSIVRFLDIEKRHKLLDIGTGAGFPGVPLKLYTDCNITLLDALNKRIKFIKEATASYGLDHFNLIHGRAEELAQKSDYREQFDFVTTRAVAHLRLLTELSLPFVKVGGYFIALKGPSYVDELMESSRAIQETGGEVERIESFKIEEYQLNHYLILIKKMSPTPKRYPRKFSTIQCQPL